MFVHENSFDLSYPLLMMFFVSLNGFTNKNVAIPNFNLMNQQSLDKILKVEVFIHTDSPLKAAYLILDYIPISKSFQASRCPFNALSKRRQPRPNLQPKERKRSLKSLTLRTLKTTLRSLINPCLLKPHQVTSATLFSHKQARHKETPPYLKIWV